MEGRAPSRGASEVPLEATAGTGTRRREAREGLPAGARWIPDRGLVVSVRPGLPLGLRGTGVRGRAVESAPRLASARSPRRASRSEPDAFAVAGPMDPALTAPSATFPVVAIGASAGGLEAFTQVLTHLPASTGMAFVLVQHLDPRHESKLGELLARATQMSVVEAQHGMTVEPNHIYVIAPNTCLTIHDGVLDVTARPETRALNLPIDAFMKALAADRKAGAIGVILSGTGSDGTLGIEDIKANGGITLAQDEESAKYSSMPQSAVRGGCVDLVLPPDGIARELARISHHPYVTTPTDAPIEPADDPESAQIEKVLRLLRTAIGVDFRGYRDSTIKRRITRRIVLHGKSNMAEYAQLLQSDRAEIDALYSDLLINVTSFFREPEVFEALKQSVFPEILKTKTAETPIRIWVPGCSTGQESYSLAMALLEFVEESPIRPQIQIFATDLSSTALQKAREGVYSENIEAEVSPERLRRFFTKHEGLYRVTKPLRDLCLFAAQNVAADPPFSRVDLISCRNVLIYLTPQLQHRIIPTFHYALQPDGFLILGASETIGQFSDLFAATDAKNRIYSKRATATRQYDHFRRDEIANGVASASPAAPQAADWQREADRVALGHYAPAGVLVNDNLDVLQFRGQTAAYLAAPPGEPSFNVLRMAREGLVLELRSALKECATSDRPVDRSGLRVRGDAEVREIDLRVLPVKLVTGEARCFLVLFEDAKLRSTAIANAETSRAASSPDAPPRKGWLRRWFALERAPAQDAGDQHELARVRDELNSTREYLQAVIEQQDTANEELQSANEETLSGNEELQSTNEELETAQEELQSTNEELTTINEQLQHRNLDLTRLSDDMTNLLGSANVAVLSVGIDLRLRRFTAAAMRTLNVGPADLGEPLNRIRLPFDLRDLDAMITEVIDTVQVREREVQDASGHWYELRVHPYRTTDNRIDGAVVVFQSVDEIKSSEETMRESRDFSIAVVETVREPLIVLDAELRVVSANRAFHKTFGAGEIENQLFYEIGGRRWDNSEMRRLLTEQLPAQEALVDFELRQEVAGQGSRLLLLNARRIARKDRGKDLMLLAIEDVTVRYQMEVELRRHIDALSEADRNKTEFLAALSHELRNPLAPLRHSLEILRLAGSDHQTAERARGVMDRQLFQMTRLVDDLLDVSRLTQGKIELRKERIDLTKVLNQIVEAYRPTLLASGQELVDRLTAQPLAVDADPVRMAQVVENLLLNSAKYSAPGTRIELESVSEGGEAVIRVRDNGVGIAPEMLPLIWDLFMQVDRALDRTGAGLGIGLTLVRSLVQMHGGSVEAHSEGVGRGSEFTVRLPLARSAQPRREPKHAVAPARSHRVLVVDDSIDQAESLGLLLELMGNEVRVAHDGLAAIAAASAFRPEVAFLDIGLPGMDGYEIAQRLRHDVGLIDTFIIALSGYGTDEDRRRTQQAGFNLHLTKPVLPDRLRRALAEIPEPPPALAS